MPTISVIIPTFNRCGLLKEAVESVRRQTLEDLEIIVVDDGSTDDTASMVAGIGDARVKYFYKPNGGPASARNVGLRNAAGEYVAFLDSDDLWTPEYLALLVGALERNSDYGAAYTTLVQVYPDGRVIKNHRARHCVSGRITEALWKKCFVWPPATVMRRDVLANHFFDEILPICEDADFFLRLSLRAKFLYVPCECVLRRIQDNSVCRLNGDWKLDLDIFKIRVFERFYFRQGGDRWITPQQARRQLSRIYCRTASKAHQYGCRKASLQLYRRALYYSPFNPSSLRGLARSVLACLKKDAHPNWNFPPPLADDITVKETACSKGFKKAPCDGRLPG